MKINFKNIKNNKKNKGFVILFAVTISAIILSIALGVANISLQEIKFGTSAKDTNEAFFAADTGVECALINDKSGGSVFVSPGAPTLNCSNNIINTTENPAGFWTFVIPGMGEDSQGCTKVTVDKTASPVTTVISKGYNVGGASCSSSNPDRIEREIKTTYVGGGVPPPPPPPSPNTGGTITVDGLYTIHTFKSNGTFTVTVPVSVEYLVIAGGGGGGGGSGGGGGAGGVVHGSSFSAGVGTYPITVGGGGVAGVGRGTRPTNGSNSVFSTFTAIGGGYGAADPGAPDSYTAGSGGSGGGGARWYDPTVYGNGGTGSQGNRGGNVVSPHQAGAGGGGAGAVGGDGSSTYVAGIGGDGVSTYSNLLIFANAGVDIGGVRWIAGGGGGSGNSGGTGGKGGGGNMQVNGVANTGGGGGGGWLHAGGTGGTGGSGIVIIKYLTP